MSELDPTDPAAARGSRTAPIDGEEELVRRAMAGDRTAFSRLMEHYQSACYGLAWRLLGNPDQAADAVQDAFIHAYTGIDRYRGGIFRSWLLRITANASYDILRRAQRRPSQALPDPEEGERELPDAAAPNPVAEAARSEMYRYLEAALRHAAGGSADRDRAVRRVRHGLQRCRRHDGLRARHGEVGIHRGRLRLRELLAEHRELFER